MLPHAGKVSKKQADELAHAEYEQFAELRREHKESIGEADSIKQLEAAAKHIASSDDGTEK